MIFLHRLRRYYSVHFSHFIFIVTLYGIWSQAFLMPKLMFLSFPEISGHLNQIAFLHKTTVSVAFVESSKISFHSEISWFFTSPNFYLESLIPFSVLSQPGSIFIPFAVVYSPCWTSQFYDFLRARLPLLLHFFPWASLILTTVGILKFIHHTSTWSPVSYFGVFLFSGSLYKLLVPLLSPTQVPMTYI